MLRATKAVPLEKDIGHDAVDRLLCIHASSSLERQSFIYSPTYSFISTFASMCTCTRTGLNLAKAHEHQLLESICQPAVKSGVFSRYTSEYAKLQPHSDREIIMHSPSSERRRPSGSYHHHRCIIRSMDVREGVRNPRDSEFYFPQCPVLWLIRDRFSLNEVWTEASASLRCRVTLTPDEARLPRKRRRMVHRCE